MSVHSTAPRGGSRPRSHRPPPLAVLATVAGTAAAVAASRPQGHSALVVLTVAPLLGLLVLLTPSAVRRLLGGAAPVASRPHDALSDRDLLARWSRSGAALARSAGRPEHALRIVARRALLLEEIERRGLTHRCRP